MGSRHAADAEMARMTVSMPARRLEEFRYISTIAIVWFHQDYYVPITLAFAVLPFRT